MQRGDTRAIAGSMHPEALAQLKAFLMVLAQAERSGPEIRAALQVPEASAVESLAPVEVCRRCMGAVYEHSEVKAVLQGASLACIGVLSEAELQHIVYRASYGNEVGGFSMVNVITVKRDGSSWKALMTAELETMIETLAGWLDESTECLTARCFSTGR